jgi:hypothetical protein
MEKCALSGRGYLQNLNKQMKRIISEKQHDIKDVNL